MKQFFLYLFCISIVLQSVIGQFMLYDQSTDTFYCSISIPTFSSPTSSISQQKQLQRGEQLNKGEWLQNEEQHQSGELGKGKSEVSVELPKLVRDSIVEHLFSPSNCPEGGQSVIFFSYLFLGHCFNLFAIEEKIHNFVHFYAALCRNIEIGLPATKLIYPHHNFY